MDRQWLDEHGFTLCSYRDEMGESLYVRRFCVYKDNNSIQLDCEILMHDNGSFDIDVYDGSPGRAKYAPWYIGEDTIVVRKIKEKIDKEIERLGLYKYSFDSKLNSKT